MSQEKTGGWNENKGEKKKKITILSYEHHQYAKQTNTQTNNNQQPSLWITLL